jgi:hypothetical protein
MSQAAAILRGKAATPGNPAAPPPGDLAVNHNLAVMNGPIAPPRPNDFSTPPGGPVSQHLGQQPLGDPFGRQPATVPYTRPPGHETLNLPAGDIPINVAGIRETAGHYDGDNQGQFTTVAADAASRDSTSIGLGITYSGGPAAQLGDVTTSQVQGSPGAYAQPEVAHIIYPMAPQVRTLPATPPGTLPTAQRNWESKT